MLQTPQQLQPFTQGRVSPWDCSDIVEITRKEEIHPLRKNVEEISAFQMELQGAEIRISGYV